MVTIDESGFLTFVARYKEILKIGGENVDPLEVEAFILRHPAVSQAKVVGVPDQRLGEVAIALVQLKTSVVTTEGELIDFCRGQLASFKIPRRVLFVSDYPLTAAGKVQRSELRIRAISALGL
jgi:fatty-acyl-CoA synthase